ncbi:siderophore-interacting FAD-binding domain protein [Yersinia rohdei]|uniref:Siderophore-interacting FAD-binding domain protein n=1 Tax=Yersinia rohdei TaxID=29485 RepID=A0ABN4F7W2_YERRO|nr:siderophore-interacting protein [Yersinia rohdei]AJJ12435.1 siderophore-interacting FAD-binding domain protein [Yersinia rohdei]EEQ02468.1 FAD-binding 9 siderophore-interacting domain protein [Yersinia rohdei ATCC 43380]MDN0093378.1 siderophore-interacting protein [Yersinia rohdei]
MTTESTAAKPKYRPTPPRLVQVKKVVDISPHLRRITFHSPTLENYPSDCAGAHLKIFLPLAHQTQPELPVLSEKGPIWPAADLRPIVRTYSVRAIRAAQAEIDIEFALHDHHGPAVSFARNAKIGDWLGITNPGGPETMLPAATFSYLVGDPSSLPALAALLATLPADAKGRAIIRVDTSSDILDLVKPSAVELSWVIGGTEQTDEVIAQFCALNLPMAEATFWLAGEDRMVVALRRYLRREKGCERQQLYAVPYWREGLNEEDYHHKRHAVMDNIDS